MAFTQIMAIWTPGITLQDHLNRKPHIIMCIVSLAILIFPIFVKVDEAVTVKFNKLVDTFKLKEDEEDKGKDIEDRMHIMLGRILSS